MKSLWIDDYFGTIYSDGSVEFYSEGDIRVPYKVLRKFLIAADQFMRECDARSS